MITDLTGGDSRHSCVPDRPSLLKQTPGREPSRREWVSPHLLVRPSEEAATSAHCPPQSRAVPGSCLTTPLAAVTLVHAAGDAILSEPDKQKVATTSYPGLPRTFLGLKRRVSHPGSPLSLGQALQGFHQGAHQTGGCRTLSHSGPLTPGNRHRVTALVGMVVLEGGRIFMTELGEQVAVWKAGDHLACLWVSPVLELDTPNAGIDLWDHPTGRTKTHKQLRCELRT